MNKVEMANFDYYEFQRGLVIEKIQEEINFYNQCEFSGVPPINQYLIYLKGRIGTDKHFPTVVSHYDGLGNKCEIKKMNLDEYVKDMDIMTFRRPWNKLKEFHKIMKFREFVDHLEFKKNLDSEKIEKNKEYLKEELCNGLKTKRFNKNKSEVTYDQEQMQIISISSLEYHKKTGLYRIDWDN